MSQVNGPLVLRLVVLAFVMVLLQLMFFAQVPVFGSIADLSPLVVMAVGLLCGSVTGATMGFAIGLMIDTALLQTMGLSSLVLIAVRLLGRAGCATCATRRGRSPRSCWARAPRRSRPSATASASSCSAPTHPVGWLLLKQTLATIVLDALIALPVTALVRRWLTPVLPEDPRRRRRRAYTTGGLSPLHKA